MRLRILTEKGGNKLAHAVRKAVFLQGRQGLCSSLALAAGMTGATLFSSPVLAADYRVDNGDELRQAIMNASTDPDNTYLFLSDNVRVEAPAVLSPAVEPSTLIIDTTGGYTLTLDGQGTVWDGGSYTYVGVEGSLDGGLALVDGAQLTINDNPANPQPYAIVDFRSGNLNIAGSGTHLSSTYMAVGRTADSTVIVSDGARVTTTESVTFGEDPATTGAANITLLVDGEDTRWDAAYFAAGGTSDNVEVTLSGGAAIVTDGASIGRNGNASMLVSGADTHFTASHGLSIGERSSWVSGPGLGTGTLTLSNGALVSAASVRLGITGTNDHDSSIKGALVVDTGATLETAELAPGLGGGIATFNNGILRATSDQGPLIHGFEEGRFILHGSGLSLDSNGFEVLAESAMSGDGALTKKGAGTLTVTGNNTYSGETRVESGTLAAGAVEAFSAASALRVATDARLNLQGYAQTISALENAGDVDLGGAPGAVLTVTGDYLGTGGTIHFNTTLGDDASVTDRLVIEGNTSGTSNVAVTNIGGAGAQTLEGIKIIDVGGTSGGIFTLVGDYEFAGEPAVVAGAYAYQLFQGGASTPNDGNWYLRSRLMEQAPLYHAGAPLYEVYPQHLLALNDLPTLQQRVGNRFWSGAGAGVENGQESVTEGRGLQVRIEGAHTDMDPAVSTTSARYDQDRLNLQAGLDLLLSESRSGRVLGGINVFYTRGWSDIASPHGVGEIDTDGYGFDATLTWYGTDGFYVDAQAQASWYDSDLTSNTTNRALASGNHAFGYALSLETGKRVALNNGWSVTPQVQLVYADMDFDDFVDPFDTAVSLDDGDSFKARPGIALSRERAWTENDGTLSRSHFYGIANLYYEFLQGTTITLAGVELLNRPERLWGELGIGGSYNWNDDRYSVYGEGTMSSSLASFGDSHEVVGTVGFRIRW